MTYITIDTHNKQALLFLEYVKTLPFVKVYEKPNAETLKAMEDAKNGKTKKIKNAKGLIAYLNK
ncbi:MAG: hypothetical protein HKL88_01580 [Bacteroidia bacterium]|nr:hypothetical protein [Bacteroidia bacterium]